MNLSITGCGGRFGVVARLYYKRSQLFWRSWVRLPLPTGKLSLRFNSWPVMSSPNSAIWNKEVRLLPVLKLWPIAETLVISENDGRTVTQLVAHTIHLWPHGLRTPCGLCLSRLKAQQSVLCLSQAAAIVALAYTTQQQRCPNEEYILVGG